MSAESTNDASEAATSRPTEARILLHVPDLTAPPVAPMIPMALSQNPGARTRGMEVLQRVLSRRSGLIAGLTGPNRWQNRLWLATSCLIAFSGLMLAIGMRQSSGEKHTAAVAADPALHEEFENDLGPSEPAGTVHHVAAYHSPNEATQSAIIQPVAYEATTSASPRGAWLEGTILPDDSDER